MRQGLLPNFRRLRNKSLRLTSKASVSRKDNEPWIQWHSAYTGLSAQAHRVEKLGQKPSIHPEYLWTKLESTGQSSVIISPMNGYLDEPKDMVTFIPSPWDQSSVISPPSLRPVWSFFSNWINNHSTSEDLPASAEDLLRVCLELSIPEFVYTNLYQALYEIKAGPQSNWRFGYFIDDFLAKYLVYHLSQGAHAYGSVFLNCLAHYQHHFWREFEEDLFAPGIRSPDCHIGDNPVLWGYQKIDELLGWIVDKLPDATIVIAGGLSQQPYLDQEISGGRNYYRLIDHQAFVFEVLNEDYLCSPLMNREWILHAGSSDAASEAARKLEEIKLNQESIFSTIVIASDVFIKTRIERYVKPNERFDRPSRNSFDFYRFFARTALKSADHIPESILWVSNTSAPILRPAEIQIEDYKDLILAILKQNETRDWDLNIYKSLRRG